MLALFRGHYLKVIALASVLTWSIAVGEDSCLKTNNPRGLPAFPGYGDAGPRRRIWHKHQAIIPSYRLRCNGSITEWGVDLNPDFDYLYFTFILQVWRPSPTASSNLRRCYSLVDDYRTTLSVDYYTPVATVTPSPRDQIEFKTGDVLGFYVESHNSISSFDNGVALLNGSVYTSELVWHASITALTSTSGNCPYPVGQNGILKTSTHAAPIISISITTTHISPTATSKTSFQTNAIVISNSFTLPYQSSIATQSTSESDKVPTTTYLGPLVGTMVLIIFVVCAASVVVMFLIILRKHSTTTSSETCTFIALSNQTYGEHFRVHSPENMYENPDMLTQCKLPVSSVSMNQGRYHAEAVLPDTLGPDTSARSGDVAGSSQDEASDSITCDCHHSSQEGLQIAHCDYDTNQNNNKEPADYEVPIKQLFDKVGPIAFVSTAEKRNDCLGDVGGQLDDSDNEFNNKVQLTTQDEVYWEPASTTSDLFSQLASKKYREIPRQEIRTCGMEKLGSGEFGDVCKATWSFSGTTKEIAIKTLKTGSSESDQVRFLQEAAIMGQFNHLFVTKLYGVVTVGSPIMICIELMARGDLKTFLGSLSTKKQNLKELELQLLKFSRQIASGMTYLSKKKFVHRDLAARNILLDEQLNSKISDFGMARDLVDDAYYVVKSNEGKIPIKWTAPEALFYKKYSSDSDVWSYGMVLFEVWSVGKKPFSDMTNQEVVRKLNSGYCQPPPPGCPRPIYKLMVDCWNPLHSKRPPFSQLSIILNESTNTPLEWRDDQLRDNQLGAELSKGSNLYEDLQNIYLEKQK